MFTKANAKINLGFNVLSKKDDGYHLIDSIYLPLTLHDSIEIQIIPGANDTYVTCDSFVSIPSTYNLAHIAISKARDIFHFKEQFRINIHKAIPMGAGLGGGSSDAAACLKAIFKMLNIHPSKEELRSLALSVGADVVYFLLLDEPARVDGVGERLRPIDIKKDYYCLLVKPDESLSTKEVYEKSDEYDDLPVANLDAIERHLTAVTLNDIPDHPIPQSLAKTNLRDLPQDQALVLPQAQPLSYKRRHHLPKRS